MQFRSLPGLMDYAQAQTLQSKLIEQRLADEIPDTTLFLEHSPVITRGRGLQWTGETRPRQMPITTALPSSMAMAESERGGDLTYHGPGQLVVYPICRLDGSGWGPDRDVTAFIRKLEQTCILMLKDFGLESKRIESATGIWIESKPHDLKIASIGIAVRKWVTFHGLALNVINDLSPFQLISPCGFQSEVMTRLLDHLPLHPATQTSTWRQSIETAWIKASKQCP